MIIELDGWQIDVTWADMYPGDSFFVPSINWPFDREAIQASADAAGCQVHIVGVIEESIRGLRVFCEFPCYT